MKFPLMLAIKLVEAFVPDEYVGAVSETPTEYTMDLRFKHDDEWCDDDVWAVSKKQGVFAHWVVKRALCAMTRSSGSETRTSKKAYISRIMELEIKADDRKAIVQEVQKGQ